MRILLVEDGFQRGALAATRALGSAGHFVGIADPVRGHSARSRYSTVWHRIPAPSHEVFIDRIRDIVVEGGYDIVVPGDDEHLWALSPRRAEIPALFPYAEHTVVARALDKLQILPVAARHDLKVPPTVDPDGDIPSQGPFVVKENIHSLLGGRSRFDVRIARDREEIASILGEPSLDRGNLFIQPFIRGDLMAVVTLSDTAGHVIYSAHQRATCTYPASAGVSTRAKIVRNDHVLDTKIARFLEELGWQGLMELQFLETPQGEQFLVDMNGRFYGSMQLVVSAGADLPNAWVALAMGAEPPPLPPARPGTRYQWLEGDIRRALESDEQGGIRSGIGYSFGANHSMVSWRDPLPAASFLWRYLTRRTKRKMGMDPG